MCEERQGGVRCESRSGGVKGVREGLAVFGKLKVCEGIELRRCMEIYSGVTDAVGLLEEAQQYYSYRIALDQSARLRFLSCLSIFPPFKSSEVAQGAPHHISCA